MIIDKPWGFEELIEHNKYYVVKKLFMKKDHCCSLQYHELKHETIYVLSGKLKFYSGNAVDNLKSEILIPGDFRVINPKVIHRMKGIEDSYYLEASTTELDDVIRLSDNYGR